VLRKELEFRASKLILFHTIENRYPHPPTRAKTGTEACWKRFNHVRPRDPKPCHSLLQNEHLLRNRSGTNVQPDLIAAECHNGARCRSRSFVAYSNILRRNSSLKPCLHTTNSCFVSITPHTNQHTSSVCWRHELA
jgi:hypothetical protein